MYIIENFFQTRAKSSNATSDAMINTLQRQTYEELKKCQRPPSIYIGIVSVYPSLLCERVFSKVRKVLSKRRNRLSPNTQTALISK